MNKLRTLTVRLLRTCTVIGVALLHLGTAAVADTANFDQIVAFGDSLMDSGNAFVLTGEVATPPFESIPSAAYAIGAGREVSLTFGYSSAGLVSFASSAANYSYTSFTLGSSWAF